LPKRCGIKVYYYKTSESEGFRDALAFDPKTVEGALYDQIKAAVELTTEIIESMPKMGELSLESVTYPNETLHDIITNAALHRDYSIADDVHVRIFNNRIEVQSPGRLPAHVTIANILDERFARNGTIVRILNKFPNPPNKDVGEALNTAFEAMHHAGLKSPTIIEKDNSVLVLIKHERLASAEEAIMDYLETHDTIKNREARKITHLRADYQVKAVFNRMVKAGMIEQVPGTRTSNTTYRKKQDGDKAA
jgi:ATP-dependent DNA helicase RecG